MACLTGNMFTHLLFVQLLIKRKNIMYNGELRTHSKFLIGDYLFLSNHSQSDTWEIKYRYGMVLCLAVSYDVVSPCEAVLIKTLIGAVRRKPLSPPIRLNST